MRIFAAVDVSPAAQEGVTALIIRLKRHGAYGRASVRWVGPGNLHLTLQFLGHVASEGGLARAEQALDGPYRSRAFQVGLGGGGVLPSHGAPRVVWLGARRGAGKLLGLHDEISARLENGGVLFDALPFHPHLTIGRIRRATRGDAERILASVEDIGVVGPSWVVDRIVLYESRLSSIGSACSVVATNTLAPR